MSILFQIFFDINSLFPYKKQPGGICRQAVQYLHLNKFYMVRDYTRRLTETIVLYVASLLILIPS